MNNQILLNKLYILSGPSGSGKTYFLNKLIENGLNQEAVISVEGINNYVLGNPFAKNDYVDIKKMSFKSIIKEIIDIRLSQNMATFIDDDNLNDEVRREYVNIAKKHGMQYEIIIFDIPEDMLMVRTNKTINNLNIQLGKFNKSSIFPHFLLNEEDINKKYTAIPVLLNTLKVDVIGDSHGLLTELILLLNKIGWNYSEKNMVFSHEDKERKLFFLGDIVDRGTQSIDLLKAVKNTVQNNNAILILGNHEEKLISSYVKYLETGIVLNKSLSSTQTLVDFLKLDKEEREDLFYFLIACPVRLSIWVNKDNGEISNENVNVFKVGFCHANNDSFNEFFIPRSLALYGKRSVESKDTDFLYEENFKNGINDSVLMRGHIFQTSKQNNVYSLEDDQAFEGNLVVLQLDKYVNFVRENNWVSNYSFFEKSTVKYKTEFNFNKYIKGKIMLLNEMNNLVKTGLATDGWRKDESGQKQPHEDGFKVFKYSKMVHFKRLWKTNQWLEKARGLVLDSGGSIVVHPFDKLYNFGEYDVGQNVDKSKKVQVIEKMNGYLGCISKHPFKNELFLSTTGSIAKDAPFVKMIEDFITPELNGKLLHFLKNNKMTLLFEVLHKNDPHIIEYEEKDYGLWLIGARKLTLSEKPETEVVLDALAKKLEFKRPKWEEKTFGEVLESLQTSQLEGFMIRDAENNEPLMKIKTNYYLVTKFVGRMGKKMVAMMFNHPEQFKEEKVDEEFYPIVDKIISTISENDFNEMPQDKRVLFVREIVNATRNDFIGVSKNKLSFK